VVDVMNKMPEESRYLRGMRSWVGFKQVGFPYDRDERAAGESKYNFKQLFRLAYNGIFNFSEFPIKFMTNMGGLAILIALLYFVVVLIKKFFFTQVIEGFTALLFVIILFSGVQLFALGIIGEYVLRIFFQSKQRPLFIIKEEIVNCDYVEPYAVVYYSVCYFLYCSNDCLLQLIVALYVSPTAVGKLLLLHGIQTGVYPRPVCYHCHRIF